MFADTSSQVSSEVAGDAVAVAWAGGRFLLVGGTDEGALSVDKLEFGWLTAGVAIAIEELVGVAVGILAVHGLADSIVVVLFS